MIRSFELTEKDQKLIISLNEKEPAYSLYLVDDDNIIPVELNKKLQVISAGKMYSSNLPLVYINKEEMNKNSISLKIKNFLKMINDIRNRNLKIIDDILEIEYINAVSIKVRLKGRKTAFYLKPDLEGFNKLNFAVGYFDMIKYYPDTFTMLNGFGIVK